MDRHHAKAVAIGINRMFEKSSFSICDVRNLMEVTKAQENQDFKALRVYHCMDYAEMDDETKQWIFRTVLENVGNTRVFPKVALTMSSPGGASEALGESVQPPKGFLPRRAGLLRFLGKGAG